MDGLAQLWNWNKLLRKSRAFFDKKGFCEISTRHLVRAGAFEGTLDPIRATGEAAKWDLHTSPEIEMKKIFSRFHIPLYQICHCFRDDPDSPHHAKEFTMLEYYEPGVDYRSAITNTKDFLFHLSDKEIPMEEYTIEEAFQKWAGFELPVNRSAEEFRHIATEKDIHTSETDEWEDVFFRVLLERIEPALTKTTPTILKDFPTLVSPLSRQSERAGISERFELYWKGMELCNGCTELGSGEELEKRYLIESDKRKKAGKEPHPFPHDLKQAIDGTKGIYSGVAYGMDRIFACLTGSETIHSPF
jgi:lysyl-tRNA synthetase class 2